MGEPAAAASLVTGPRGPARQRVRAEGACSVLMAAVSLAAMLDPRATGVW